MSNAGYYVVVNEPDKNSDK